MPRTKHPDDLVEQIRAHAKEPVSENQEQDSYRIFLPTGSTLLNLALSDTRSGGFAEGKLINLIGDSSSGKTLIALTVLAEMATRSKFDEYRLILDDVEAACEFDLRHLFGSATERIEPPEKDDEGTSIPSDTIEGFQVHLQDAIRDGRPFVYVLDSLDALDALDDRRKAEQDMEDLRKGKEVGGSYRMAKPKMLSEILRRCVRDLKKTRGTLIVISQTRDNINPMSFAKKTRSGGRALEFYSSYEIWTAVEEKIRRKERIVGIGCQVKVTKNKFSGKRRQVGFPIFDDYGIDDLGSCVDFLIAEGVWKSVGKKIQAEGIGITSSREKLIQDIEQGDLEKKVRKIVARTWKEIEEAIRVDRKRKYA